MRNSTVTVALAVALSACASSQDACRRERETFTAMRYTGELLPYTCGYRGSGTCAPRSPAGPPAGYSKDDTGNRSASRSPAPARVRGVPATLPANVRRVGPTFYAYRFGAYVDPRDKRIVHAAHTVYRREGEARWEFNDRMRPAGAAEIAAAPVAAPSPAPSASPSPGPSVTPTPDDRDQRLQALNRRVSDLETARRTDAQALNANQRLLVGQINQIKGALNQAPVPAAQADPNAP